MTRQTLVLMLLIGLGSAGLTPGLERMKRRAVKSPVAAIMPLAGQETVTIHATADAKLGTWQPIWRYFRYDKPNYTYMKYGPQLLGELSALSSEPVYIRTHDLLATGNGVPTLKCGSTNAYTEDATGRPTYGWTIVNRIFDAYRDAGVKRFVEIGFMPEALSIHPQPYQHDWPKGPLGPAGSIRQRTTENRLNSVSQQIASDDKCK